MLQTYFKLKELEEELKQIVQDLKKFKSLAPYEQAYVWRRSHEILREEQQLLGQVLTIDKGPPKL